MNNNLLEMTDHQTFESLLKTISLISPKWSRLVLGGDVK